MADVGKKAVPPGRTVTRRALLSAAGAVTLGACAPAVGTEANGTSTATGRPRIGASTAARTPTASPVTPSYPPASAYDGLAPTAWGMDLPGIVSAVPTVSGRPTLALTFDACGGPGGSAVDRRILDLLRRDEVPATLFLNRRWIEANLPLAGELAADPLFMLENHGTRHVPLSVTGRAAYGIAGTDSPAEVIEEIDTNRRLLAELMGAPPVWFRTGTAHYDDVAVRIARDRGVRLAGFGVNGDQGATLPARTVATNLVFAPDGAIVLCHLNQPHGGTAEGLARALPGLLGAGTQFTHLPTHRSQDHPSPG